MSKIQLGNTVKAHKDWSDWQDCFICTKDASDRRFAVKATETNSNEFVIQSSQTDEDFDELLICTECYDRFNDRLVFEA